MRSNKTRSTLTALGVIIGIVAVTLMGTAIGGIQVGFDKSMAIFGDDVLYVSQWPWKPVDDWWNFRDRKKIKTDYTEPINRIIAATPNSNLVIAVPTSSLLRSVKHGQSEVSNVLIREPDREVSADQWATFQSRRCDLKARHVLGVIQFGLDCRDAVAGLPKILQRQKRFRHSGQSKGQNEARRSKGRTDRSHATCARVGTGEKGRLQH